MSARNYWLTSRDRRAERRERRPRSTHRANNDCTTCTGGEELAERDGTPKLASSPRRRRRDMRHAAGGPVHAAAGRGARRRRCLLALSLARRGPCMRMRRPRGGRGARPRRGVHMKGGPAGATRRGLAPGGRGGSLSPYPAAAVRARCVPPEARGAAVSATVAVAFAW